MSQHSVFGDGLSLLGFVLERFPVEDYAELPLRRLDPAEVAFTARQWCEEGQTTAAIALLVPLLRHPEKLDLRHEQAFDELCNAYLDLGDEDSRWELIDHMLTAKDARLRAVVWQRQATMLADAGESEACWAALAEAQRADPDSPSLAPLEITLHLAQGETERAQQRARYWLQRLRRRKDVDPAQIEMLEECAEDPQRWLDRLHGSVEEDEDEELFGEDDGEFEDEYDPALYTEGLPRFLAAAQPPQAPQSHYGLQVLGESAGELTPDAALLALEQQWEQLFPRARNEDIDQWQDLSWVDWLSAHPLALQSFSVIENLLDAIYEMPLDDEELSDRSDRLSAALVGHALALLRLVFEENGATGKTLEWGWMGNRPALRLINLAASEAQTPAARVELYEWLVFTLNPNDNQGLRKSLLHECLWAGQPERAWKVCERYPDDMLTGMLYGRALTLFRLERREDADAALRAAINARPEVAKLLTAKRRNPPHALPEFIGVGSKEEAYLYCAINGQLWREQGVQDWLKAVARV
jgi:hypothetical protein